MNDYPVWWEQTLTIYNKYEDATTQIITWYRHVVPNCFWKYHREVMRIDESVLETSNIICRIPKDDLFKERYEWVELPNDTMGEYFTLGVGDIIVRGEVSDEIDEYARNHRSSDLVAKYKELQGCMLIETVAINVGKGRCNEHYLAIGN